MNLSQSGKPFACLSDARCANLFLPMHAGGSQFANSCTTTGSWVDALSRKGFENFNFTGARDCTRFARDGDELCRSNFSHFRQRSWLRFFTSLFVTGSIPVTECEASSPRLVLAVAWQHSRATQLGYRRRLAGVLLPFPLRPTPARRSRRGAALSAVLSSAGVSPAFCSKPRHRSIPLASSCCHPDRGRTSADEVSAFRFFRL